MRVVCRVHDGGNDKARPPWFTKELTLASLIRAADEADASVLFLADGPLGASLIELLAGRTVEPVSRGGSARSTYRAMLARAAQDTPDDELVWFSEDDYLYRPDALRLVAAAAGEHYVTVVGTAVRDMTSSRWTPRAHLGLGAAAEPAPVRTADVTWFRSMATTSTFGVRGRVLREDLHTLRTCPFVGGSWDTTTSLVLQGLRPFEVRGLMSGQGSVVRDRAGELVETASPSRVGAARVVARAAARVVLSTLAVRRPSRRRLLLAPEPELACHADEATVRGAGDWAAVADEMRSWTHGGG